MNVKHPTPARTWWFCLWFLLLKVTSQLISFICLFQNFAPKKITNIQSLLIYIILNCYAGLGYCGAAMATAVSFWLQFLTLLVYILFLKVCAEPDSTLSATSNAVSCKQGTEIVKHHYKSQGGVY